MPGDYYTYGTACTEVEIDVLTGEHQVNFNIRGDTIGFSKNWKTCCDFSANKKT